MKFKCYFNLVVVVVEILSKFFLRISFIFKKERKLLRIFSIREEKIVCFGCDEFLYNSLKCIWKFSKGLYLVLNNSNFVEILLKKYIIKIINNLEWIMECIVEM